MAAQDKTAAQDGRVKPTKDTDKNKQPAELQNLNYELLLIGLSLLSVFNIALLLVVQDPVARGVIDIINVPLTIIFFIDFLIRFRSAESKPKYFFRQFGWADLAASLPFPAL